MLLQVSPYPQVLVCGLRAMEATEVPGLDSRGNTCSRLACYSDIEANTCRCSFEAEYVL